MGERKRLPRFSCSLHSVMTDAGAPKQTGQQAGSKVRYSNRLLPLQLRTADGEAVQFIVYYNKNEIHFRQILSEPQEVENTASKEKIRTPIGTRDFVFRLYVGNDADVDIFYMFVTGQGQVTDTVVCLAQYELARHLFKIPLDRFQIQLDQSGKLVGMAYQEDASSALLSFGQSSSQCAGLTMAAPITSDVLVGYDQVKQGLVLIDQKSSSPRVAQHEIRQFARLDAPAYIFVDPRGYNQDSVAPGKSSVILLYDTLASIDCFQYRMEQRVLKL